MDNKLTFIASNQQELDIKDYLKNIENLSSRLVRKALREGRIFLNKKKVIKKAKVNSNDIIYIYMPKEEHQNIEPEKMKLHIIYEDEDILVINKQPGIVVHPTKRHPNGTLSNGVLYYFKENNEKCIVRLVSRLDMDTSGLILIAKNQFSHMALARDMEKEYFKKMYIAVVHGNMHEKQGVIDLPIGRSEEESIKRVVTDKGQNSITKYKVIESLKSGDIVQLELETGRTHQIRVHMSHINHPLYGDSLYGKEEKDYINRQALHAYRLEFPHPRTSEIIKLEAPIPEDIINLIAKIKENC